MHWKFQNFVLYSGLCCLYQYHFLFSRVRKRSAPEDERLEQISVCNEFETMVISGIWGQDAVQTDEDDVDEEVQVSGNTFEHFFG